MFLLLVLPALVQAEEVTDEEFKRNGFELFAGGTFTDGESNASFGMNYERRLTKTFGLGGIVEYTNGREWVYALSFSYRITDAWKVMVAPGFEHEEGENTYPPYDSLSTRKDITHQTGAEKSPAILT